MIKCKHCGGSMKEVKVNANEKSAYERYKCQSCGSYGSVTVDLVTMNETKSGAVA